MKILPKPILCATLLALIAAAPAQARHHGSHHGGAHHAHHGSRSHGHSVSHHVRHAAHAAASYGAHYEMRRAVRAALAPIDGRGGEASNPRYSVAHDSASAYKTTSAPAAADRSSAPADRVEYSHAGPRIGLDLAPGETRIATVSQGSPAWLAGLDPGDVITAANSSPVKTAEDLAKAISVAAPSGALKLTIQRAGQNFNATVALDRSQTP